MLLGSLPPSTLSGLLAPLLARARHDLLAEGLQEGAILLQPQLDMRYQGQSYELTVPWPSADEDFLEGFQSAHQSTYGYTLAATPVEIVNLRLHAVGHLPPIPLPSQLPSGSDPQPALLGHRPVMLAAPPAQIIPLYRGEALRAGNCIQGPALIARSDTTIFLTPGDEAVVDPYLDLLIKIR